MSYRNLRKPLQKHHINTHQLPILSQDSEKNSQTTKEYCIYTYTTIIFTINYNHYHII